MKDYKVEVECPQCGEPHMAKANYSQATRRQPPQFLGYSVYCATDKVEVEIDHFTIRWAIGHGAPMEFMEA